jgi:hypothetical protein
MMNLRNKQGLEALNKQSLLTISNLCGRYINQNSEHPAPDFPISTANGKQCSPIPSNTDQISQNLLFHFIIFSYSNYMPKDNT